MSHPIIIDLDPNARHEYERLVPYQRCELIRLVLQRCNNFETHLSIEQEYAKHRRHDSILIDGTRGTGKSTLIEFLFHHDELKKNACILPIIDPNQINKHTRVLDIVMNNIFDAVRHHRNETSQENESLYGEICRLKQRIDTLSFGIMHKQQSIDEMNRMTDEERRLDQTVHRFAHTVCRYFGDKKALVQPIDDIDMQIDYGAEIVETIQKYFQSPRIIPVIALDSGQIYALIKQQYFQKFGYDARTPLKAIAPENELEFLKKLPSEFIQKILPPSQRIVLPDMLTIYKMHLEGKPERTISTCEGEDTFTIRFKARLNHGEEITLDFEQLLLMMMNVFFGFYDREAIKDPLDYHIVNYLKNKTFRSFKDDARALIGSLVLRKDREETAAVYRVDSSHLKKRFRLYSKAYANNQYDAAAWFWDNYIARLYDKLDSAARKTEYNKASSLNLDMIEDILMVTPADSSSLGRKEKTYYRLYMQDFFIEHIDIRLSKASETDRHRVEKIEKTLNMPGYIEFLVRTIFPAALFETLFNEGLLSLEYFPIERLRDFSRSDILNTLSEIYDEWVPMWLELYGFEDKEEGQPIQVLGVTVDETSSKGYRKRILNFSKFDDIVTGQSTYYLHPFRVFAFMAEFREHRQVSDRLLYQYMPKSYLNENSGSLKSAKELLKKAADSPTDMTLSNSSIGIISSIKYTKSAARNLLAVLLQMQSMKTWFHDRLSENGLSEAAIKELYKHEVRKQMISAEAVFINAVILTLVDTVSLSDEDERNIKFSLNKDYLYSGIRKHNTLLPFITDDPFARNLGLLFELPEEALDKNVLKRLFHIANLPVIYKPALHKRQETLKEMKRFFHDEIVNTTDAIHLLLGTRTTLKNAYLELFDKIIFSHDENTCSVFQDLAEHYRQGKNEHVQHIICSKLRYRLYSAMKHKPENTREIENIAENIAKDISDNWRKPCLQKLEDLYRLLLAKKRDASEDNDYFRRNALILFLDALTYYPNFTEIFMSYLEKTHQTCDKRDDDAG